MDDNELIDDLLVQKHALEHRIYCIRQLWQNRDLCTPPQFADSLGHLVAMPLRDTELESSRYHLAQLRRAADERSEGT